MITAIRQKTGLTQAAALAKKPIDPVELNKGSLSLIMSQLQEVVEEAVRKQDYGRVTLDIRLDQSGIQDYDLVSGIQRNVK